MENGGNSIVMEEAAFVEDIPCAKKCRDIRTYYRKMGNRIHDGKDELGGRSSKKFIDIINEVENIHQFVIKPREQVADAEALLGLTSILTASVKSHATGGVTPAEFVSCLIKHIELQRKTKGFSDTSHNDMWDEIGSDVSCIFMRGSGCRTMIGPMRSELKQRKIGVRGKRVKPVRKALPKELENTAEMISDTDLNIHTMFDIMKRQKRVGLENLILNRNSFAQTIENLFALSFLVKDGRAHLDVDAAGSHVIVPRNGPSAEEIKTGVVQHHHFVFRYDFDDWKLMKRSVPEGEELMPQRHAFDMKSCSAKGRGELGDEDFGIPEAIPLIKKLPMTLPHAQLQRKLM